MREEDNQVLFCRNLTICWVSQRQIWAYPFTENVILIQHFHSIVCSLQHSECIDGCHLWFVELKLTAKNSQPFPSIVIKRCL